MDYGILALVVVILAGFAMMASAGVERRITRLDHRLAQVERKLDAVLAHHGIALPEPELDRVHVFLRQGKKIEAIKAYRENTGASLKEAKEAVERLAGQR